MTAVRTVLMQRSIGSTTSNSSLGPDPLFVLWIFLFKHALIEFKHREDLYLFESVTNYTMKGLLIIRCKLLRGLREEIFG